MDFNHLKGIPSLLTAFSLLVIFQPALAAPSCPVSCDTPTPTHDRLTEEEIPTPDIYVSPEGKVASVPKLDPLTEERLTAPKWDGLTGEQNPVDCKCDEWRKLEAYFNEKPPVDQLEKALWYSRNDPINSGFIRDLLVRANQNIIGRETKISPDDDGSESSVIPKDPKN